LLPQEKKFSPPRPKSASISDHEDQNFIPGKKVIELNHPIIYLKLFFLQSNFEMCNFNYHSVAVIVVIYILIVIIDQVLLIRFT
jgi:hypothetical protein